MPVRLVDPLSARLPMPVRLVDLLYATLLMPANRVDLLPLSSAGFWMHCSHSIVASHGVVYALWLVRLDFEAKVVDSDCLQAFLERLESVRCGACF